MSGEVDVSRLRNWVRAFERLMRGGLGEQAHTACVDEFASDEGEYPYVTPGDVSHLLDEVERLRETVARVEALARWWDTGPCADRDSMTREAAAYNLRGALDSQRHTGTPDASQAADGPLSASEGHVSATDLAQAAARTKQAARERVERGGLG